MGSSIINLNAAVPAAPSLSLNVIFAKATTPSGNDTLSGYPIYPVSASVPYMVGDSGLGGAAGLVPPAPSGSAAAGKYLKADGSFAVPLAAGAVLSKTANYSIAAADAGSLISFNSGSSIQLLLLGTAPASPWMIFVENIGAGVLTINPNGRNLDGAGASLTIQQNSGILIFSNGTDYLTERGAAGYLISPVAANLIFGGPASGSPAVPAFRALTPADVPIAGGFGVSLAGASVPNTGFLGAVQLPYKCTINSWTIITNSNLGSAQFDVKKSTYAAYPTTASIVASAPPAVTSAQKATSSTLTGWTTACSLGDIIEFYLTSVSTATILSLILVVTRG